ncbi:TM2 domain-containing protein [Rhodococcus sp. PvR099]|uniref:TM2 domain-containing protein n=1 Tax=Rhodococcus sp. PvR099 TaxID=2806602 RepID=UPI001B7C6DCB|nr:TM2 domain-containing protein [Rhodococcus sp. PvR099]MBP1159111.1 TM2 domain-containing membrane protein YozV [Rhodococcus sp. PvR099]
MSEVPEGGSTPGPVYGPEGTGPGWLMDAGATAPQQEAYGQQPTQPQPQAYGQQPTQAQPQAYGQPPVQPFGQPYAQQPYGQQPFVQPAYFGGAPAAPFGRDPLTGEPLSDKSKATAGLLQILLPFVGICGVGRLYVGSTGIGLAQLLLFWLGVITTFLLIGFVIFPVVWLWSFIDGIMMFSGNVKDGQGRPLRG